VSLVLDTGHGWRGRLKLIILPTSNSLSVNSKKRQQPYVARPLEGIMPCGESPDFRSLTLRIKTVDESCISVDAQ
jgi:hypothetical protein